MIDAENPIDKIKSEEIIALHSIEESKKIAEKEIVEQNEKYQKKFETIEQELQGERNAIMNKVTQYVKGMQESEKRGLTISIKAMIKMDQKKIDRSSDIIAQKILEMK